MPKKNKIQEKANRYAKFKTVSFLKTFFVWSKCRILSALLNLNLLQNLSLVTFSHRKFWAFKCYYWIKIIVVQEILGQKRYNIWYWNQNFRHQRQQKLFSIVTEREPFFWFYLMCIALIPMLWGDLVYKYKQLT